MMFPELRKDGVLESHNLVDEVCTELGRVPGMTVLCG
jgi:hypothetical protein